MSCTKFYCTLDDFVLVWKDNGHGCHSTTNYEEYVIESNKPEHYFCSSKHTRIANAKRQDKKDTGVYTYFASRQTESQSS